MYKVVITSEFFGKFSNEAKELLESKNIEVISNPYNRMLSEEDMVPLVKNADAIICDLELINKNVIDAAPNLKVISRRGVGINSVDAEYANSKSILVERTLGVVGSSVSELVMLYILAFHRNLIYLDGKMKQGKWVKTIGIGLENKTLGIIGMGSIAKKIVEKAGSFGLGIKYFSRTPNKAYEEKYGIEFSTLEEVLNESDIVTIHIPLNEETVNFINYEQMKKMKKNALLINTARGQIVNENDLAKALDEKLIAGAAIDVFDIEPKEDSVLAKFENVILTPHIGTYTIETNIDMDIEAAKNIIKKLNI